MKIEIKQLANEAPATSFTAVNSIVVAGDLSDLAASEDEVLALRPVAPFGPGGSPHCLAVESNYTITTTSHSSWLMRILFSCPMRLHR